RGFNLIERSQSCNHTLKALGKSVDVEIKRIVVTVGDLRVNRGMKSRNEPSFGTDAGDHVEERKPIILRSRKGWIGRPRVIAPAAAWRAAARLNHLIVQEQSLQRAAKFGRLLELGLAPRNGIVVRQQELAGAANDDMGFAPAVVTLEITQVVDPAG